MIAFSALGNLGRIGNCMFQMAATVGHALRMKTPAVFPAFEWSAFFPKLNFSLTPAEQGMLRRHDETSFTHTALPVENNLDLFGYFQSERYFEHCAEEIRRLWPRSDHYEPGVCALHVRRGDYLKVSEYHPVLTLGYYHAAIEHMRGRGFERFLIFSDDQEWCRQNFRGRQYSFAPGNHPIHDMTLMASCGAVIMANSSFSWWGAWLSESDHVIAPRQWFGPAYPNHSTKDLIPERWLQL